MAPHYLYGISIQGIQSFIFQTNKLKEITGASEWIESFCASNEYLASRFQTAVGEQYKVENLLQGAAGNIKYVFEEKTACERVVRTFIKELRTEIPDLVISQAVVELKEGQLTPKDLSTLNGYLDAQRSKGTASHALGLMISERSRRTGKPGFLKDQREGATENNNALLDRMQTKLWEIELRRKIAKQDTDRLKSKIEADEQVKFVKEFQPNDYNWIAVVHADGNNMGKTIRKLLEQEGDTKRILSDFSQKLTAATEDAAQTAYRKIFGEYKDQQNIPLRPIILGGDDFTFVIDAKHAVDFTAAFLAKFEANTHKVALEAGLEAGLTACAGIAYIKPKYPFHYGADLAETLTKYAKSIAKKHNKALPQSCIAFHKVHASFVENYDDIIKRELFIEASDKAIHLNFGPYFVKSKQTPTSYANIGQLQYWVRQMQAEDAPKGNVRNWLSTLHRNEAQAEELWQRMMRMDSAKRYKKALLPFGGDKFIERGKDHYTPLHDVLSLAML